MKISKLNLFDKGLATLFRVLAWLLSVIKLKEPIDLSTVKPLLSKMDTIHKTRGSEGLILWCKNQRLALLHFLSGEYPTKIIAGVSYTKDGYPKALRIPREYLLVNATLLRLVLTILYSTRFLKIGKDVDLLPITSPSLVTDPVLAGNPYLFWYSLGYRPSKQGTPKRLVFKRYHMTTKAGPNGHALWGSMADFLLLRGTPTLESIKVLGGPKLTKYINLLDKMVSLIPNTGWVPGNTLRKLSTVQDKELKVRVIAILDYFSQTSLRPLHDYLYDVLRKIPQDCTFNQGKFKEAALNWDYYDSADLSSATDRFPIKYIGFVLKGLLPENYVQAWENVMVGLPFDVPQRGSLTLEKVTYAVGNPMGAYSSWASFTVAHHFLMKTCCDRIGIPWKSAKYLILGDDVLIGDKRLSVEYRASIASLGVSISGVKSHESSKLFEFAKRLVLNGREISPFPLSALNGVYNKFYLMVNFLMEQEAKDWVWNPGIPGAISEFYRLVLHRNAVYCAKVRDRSLTTELITKVIRGSVRANDAVLAIIRQYKIPTSSRYSLDTMSEEHAQSLIAEAAQSCFLRSDPFDNRGGVRSEPLGVFATQLTMAITGLIGTSGIEVDDILNTPECIPQLNVYGQFSEEYIQVRKDVYSFGLPGHEDWPMRLRSLSLPTSDKVFSERAKHTISRVMSVFGDAIKNNIQRLATSEIWFFSARNS